jgi:hypothetical protein
MTREPSYRSRRRWQEHRSALRNGEASGSVGGSRPGERLGGGAGDTEPGYQAVRSKRAAHSCAREQGVRREPGRGGSGTRGLSGRALRARTTAHLPALCARSPPHQTLGAYPRAVPPLGREMRRGGSRREPALSPRCRRPRARVLPLAACRLWRHLTGNACRTHRWLTACELCDSFLAVVPPPGYCEGRSAVAGDSAALP